MSFLKNLFGSDEDDSNPILNDFPYQLTRVSGVKAVDEWKRLQKLWRNEGSSAVMLGDSETVRNLHENLKSNDTPIEEILKSAANITSEDFFKNRKESEEEQYSQLEEGVWPNQVPTPEFISHRNILDDQPKKTVYIAKIPTTKSFEIPAYLKYGAWNECPGAEEHVAVHRDWQLKYGTEIFAITNDIIECSVANPPRERNEAIQLAREQFFYCSDIVFQGTETLLPLAATLQSSPVWYFWWD
jgi:hypothetical protein